MQQQHVDEVQYTSSVASKEKVGLFAPELLVFHSAYVFDAIKEQGLEVFIESRDPQHIFQGILTANPVAWLQYDPLKQKRNNRHIIYELNPRNFLLEGQLKRFHLLRRFEKLDFLCSQISFFFTLLRKFRLKDVKLVRAEDPRFNGLWGLFVSKLLRKPLIVGVWGNPGRIRATTGRPIMPRLFASCHSEERFEKFVLNRSSLVLAQNEENLHYVRSLGVSEDKLKIIPLEIGIDKHHYLPKHKRVDVRPDLKSLGILNEKLIVCISRLEALKHVDEVINSLCYVSRKRKDFRLLLVGDGSQLGNLRELCFKNGLSHNVVFLGNRSQSWISGLLAISDFAVAPLAGRALLEIALAGCPVIAYDVDWHNKLVIDRQTGILVDNLQTKKLGEGISFMLEHDSEREEMGRRIKLLALNQTSPEIAHKSLSRIYESLI